METVKTPVKAPKSLWQHMVDFFVAIGNAIAAIFGLKSRDKREPFFGEPRVYNVTINAVELGGDPSVLLSMSLSGDTPPSAEPIDSFGLTVRVQMEGQNPQDVYCGSAANMADDDPNILEAITTPAGYAENKPYTIWVQLSGDRGDTFIGEGFANNTYSTGGTSAGAPEPGDGPLLTMAPCEG